MCPPSRPFPYEQLLDKAPHAIVYDPRPTTTVIHKREETIERQRQHLHDLDLWAKRLKGPCKDCRWREWGGDYANCMNPAVTRGKADPVSGTIDWTGPRCKAERKETRGGNPTLCGPEGLLFEPRTGLQKGRKWALVPFLLSIPLTFLLLVFHSGVVIPSACVAIALSTWFWLVPASWRLKE